MGWWTHRTYKEVDTEELKKALVQHQIAVVETVKKDKETKKRSNGVLEVSENALDILNRTIRESQNLREVFKNELK